MWQYEELGIIPEDKRHLFNGISLFRINQAKELAKIFPDKTIQEGAQFTYSSDGSVLQGWGEPTEEQLAQARSMY